MAAVLAGVLFAFGAFAPLQRALFPQAASLASPVSLGSGGSLSSFASLAVLRGQWLGAVVLGFGLAYCTVDISQTALRLVVAIAALVETASLSWVLHRFGITWPPFTALAAGGLATLFGFAWGCTSGGKRKHQLETLFAGRISRRTFRTWLDADAPLDITGERREGSLVVCEVFNEETLSETLSPSDYTALTQAFAAAGARSLMESGGVLDTAGGDRLRAIFGVPMPAEDHATWACAAALELRRSLETFCREALHRWEVAPDFRIAVNSGEMVVAAGYLGSFSVTGEALEFCHRLCIANTFYGSRILLGPHAFLLAQSSVEVRPMELFIPPGQQAPEEIYELLAAKDQLSPEEAERRDTFWKGIVFFREREWDLATAHFETVLRYDAIREDGPSRYYLDRIAKLRDNARKLDWEAAPL